MKKNLNPFLAGVFALLAFVSCNDKEETDNQQNGHDDAYYAAQASISSSDSNFTSSGDGGTIRFRTEGGSVVVNVDCGTDWTVDNTASDLFSTRVNTSSGTLTISAVQNTVEEELTATITVRTAKQQIAFATITIVQSAYGAPEISVTANEWHFPAVGALTAEIGVSTTAEKWEAVSSDRWVRVQTIDGGIELTAAENEGTDGRTATITVTASDGVRTETETIVVTQDGLAYATPERYKVAHSPESGSVVCAIEANLDWDFTYDGQDSWYSVVRNGDELTVTFKANDSERRDGVITIAVSDGAENVSDTEVAVTQYGTEAIIFTYTISDGNTKIYSPVSGDVNCEIDWGDGSDVETVKSVNPSHTYTAGEYTVCIDGTVTELNSSRIYSYESQNTTLTAVNQWGKTGLTSMSYAFYDYTALKSLPEKTGDVFIDVTTFDHAFFYCPLLKTIPSDIFAKSEKVTDFSYTFYFCNGLEAIPEGLFDACPEVTSFESIFYDCELVTSIPAGLFDNCPKATNFSATFYCDSALEYIPDGLFSKNTEAEDFSFVFYGCTALKSLPDDLFANCTKATSFLSAFYNCRSLGSLPSTLFEDCPKVYDFSFTFYNCVSLTEIPSNLFAKCTEVTDFYYTFYYCSGLKSLPKGLFDSNKEAEDFNSAFRSCKALESIPEGLFDNCVKAQDFGQIFYGCSLLESIPKGLFDNCPEATDFIFAFYECTSLTEIPVGLFSKNTKAKTFQAIFYNCSLIESIPDGLFDNCPSVVDFQCCFYGCSLLKSIPKGLFDNCPEVTNFEGCFYNCMYLEEVPEGLFSNCTKITDFAFAFRGCSAIKTIPVDLLSNCTKITNFQASFYNCTSWVGESPYSVVNGEKVHLYERTSELGFSVPTVTSSCFGNDTGLTDYAQIPSSWGGGASTASTKSSAATVGDESPKPCESALVDCMPFKKCKNI